MTYEFPAVYIITNKRHSVLYIGVTSNLHSRIYQHKHKLIKGFSEKYNCNKLVYYEVIDDMYCAISREKQIKSGSRNSKINLINSINPKWIDLYETVL